MYIEVAQGVIFMEQRMRFGLVLGQLAILKKRLGANYEKLLRVVFSCFQGLKINSECFLKYCRLDIHNQLCIALLKIPPCETFI